MNSPSKVRCPTCRKEGNWFAGDFGPFCSRRCRLIDLGKWFNEEHNVAEPLQLDDLDADPDVPTRKGPNKSNDRDAQA